MEKSNPIVGIQLARNGERPLYSQLAQALKELIIKGELSSGSKIPPIRQLAGILGVNNSTVVQALEVLSREGLIYKHVGRGTFVAPSSRSQPPVEGGGHVYDFSSLAPATELFPVLDFKKALNRALDYYGGEALNYQPHLGYRPLREKMAALLGQEGISVSPERIMVISGSQQGIDISAKVLLEQGETVFLEEPTYPGSLLTFQGRGVRIINIPIRQSGLDFVELEKRLADFRPRLLFVMTRLQNPTGYSYTPEQKAHLLQLAYKYNFYILEDDYLSALDYRDYRSTDPPLKAMDRWDRVILLKSFSKVLMPGLRLGFVILPEGLQEDFLGAKYAADISSSGLMQRAFSFFLQDDSWEEHLKTIRREFRSRYQLVKKFLKEQSPLLYFWDPEGGLFFWVRLNRGGWSEDLAVLLRRRGVDIAPGSAFFAGKRQTPWFRLSFATGSKKDLERGLDLLKDGLQELQTGQDLDRIPQEEPEKRLF